MRPKPSGKDSTKSRNPEFKKTVRTFRSAASLATQESDRSRIRMNGKYLGNIPSSQDSPLIMEKKGLNEVLNKGVWTLKGSPESKHKQPNAVPGECNTTVSPFLKHDEAFGKAVSSFYQSQQLCLKDWHFNKCKKFCYSGPKGII